MEWYVMRGPSGDPMALRTIEGPELLRSGPSWACDERGYVGSTEDAARAGN